MIGEYGLKEHLDSKDDIEILLKDTYEMGKKDGYSDVGAIYSEKYRIERERHDSIGKEILRNISEGESTLDSLIEEYERLENERNNLLDEYNELWKNSELRTAWNNDASGKEKGEFNYMDSMTAMAITMIPLLGAHKKSILRIIPVINVIYTIKEMKYVEGYKKGYAEYTKIHENKLKKLITEWERNLKELFDTAEEQNEDISRIIDDICEINEEIQMLHNRIIEMGYTEKVSKGMTIGPLDSISTELLKIDWRNI